MAGLGYKDFTAGAVLTAAQVDGYLMEQAVMNFAGTAARGSALSSVQAAGMMAHVGGGTVTVYDGSAWQQVYPAQAGLVFVAGTAFSAVSSVSVNNCFSATYDNYKIVTTHQSSANGPGLRMRLRVSGADSSAATYNEQRFQAESTTLTGTRALSQTQWQVGGSDDDDDANGGVIEVLRPFLATRTTVLSQMFNTFDGAGLFFVQGYFDNSTVFDGFSLLTSTGTISGSVRIYGYRNS